MEVMGTRKVLAGSPLARPRTVQAKGCPKETDRSCDGGNLESAETLYSSCGLVSF